MNMQHSSAENLVYPFVIQADNVCLFIFIFHILSSLRNAVYKMHWQRLYYCCRL